MGILTQETGDDVEERVVRCGGAVAALDGADVALADRGCSCGLRDGDLQKEKNHNA